MKALLVDDDNSFAIQLPSKLREEYTKLKNTIIKEIKDNFATNYTEYHSRKDKGIKEDKFHKEVLNSCIFPFVQTGLISSKLDYVYLRSSPLSELGLKNVDFLIASQSKGIAIFGEAKGSIEDPSTMISQYRERIDVIEQNLQTVKKYVPNLQKIEYVLGVPSMDALNTIKSILRAQIKIILWQTGGIGEQQLSLVVPPNVDDVVKKTVMHSDNDLNRMLSKIQTSAEIKTFFHESHPVTKLELLTALDKGEDNFFTYSKVKQIVEAELDNTTEKEVEHVTREIIRMGIDINFINCKAHGNYKVQSIYKNSKSRYDELKKKWIEFKHNMEMEQRINEQIRILQAEFTRKKEEQQSLEKFFK